MDWPHRTYCDTLAECREVLKVMDEVNMDRSVSTLKSLLEECQMYGNRMEAGLSYTHDLDKLHKKRKKLKLEVKALKAELPKKDDEVPQSFTTRHMDLLDDDD